MVEKPVPRKEWLCDGNCGKTLFWGDHPTDKGRKYPHEVNSNMPHECPNKKKKGSWTPKAPVKATEVAKGKDQLNIFLRDGWELLEKNGVAWSESLQEFVFVVVKR